MPAKMRENFGYKVKDESDRMHKEIKPDEIYEIFTHEYVNISAPLTFINYRPTQGTHYETIVSISIDNVEHEFTGDGNGRLDAISNILQTQLDIEYKDLVYKEHALESGSRSNAVSYVGITSMDGAEYWGCGIDADIMTSSVKALFSAVNNMITTLNVPIGKGFSLNKRR